jgi:hypothetical protein
MSEQKTHRLPLVTSESARVQVQKIHRRRIDDATHSCDAALRQASLADPAVAHRRPYIGTVPLMRFLAAATFALLAAIATLHVAWGFGLRWPASNERELVATVIGAKQRVHLPSLAQCFAVLGAGIVALLLSGLVSPLLPRPLLTFAGFLLFAVFAARGVAAYLPAWRNIFSQEPFARYDQLYYAPFCLCVALVFALLVIERLKN